MLYFGHSSINDHISIDDSYHLKSIQKTKTYWCAENMKIEIN